MSFTFPARFCLVCFGCFFYFDGKRCFFDVLLAFLSLLVKFAMGAIISRASGNREASDSASSSSAFRYPPKTGAYFANQFIMGGERFDSPQPEAYLFGENNDLNFLNSKPVPFPYTAPLPSELSKPLKCVVNIRRESLRLVRILNDYGTGSGYNIEFNFDMDVSCTVRIMYFAKEEYNNHTLSYVSRDSSLSSEKYSYKPGANQLFNQTAHVFDPSKFSEDDLLYSEDSEVIPVVIQCSTEDDEDIRQSHATLAVIEKYPDGTYSLKALKQKLAIDGLVYLLQEVYGIENKIAGGSEVSYDSGDEDYEESGGDCVVCMSDPRDTLILPCRHLCLCSGCAESLRYQANNCPICRAPFRALLQIRALQKKEVAGGNRADQDENIPAGYEAISLIEALNGPIVQKRASYGSVESEAVTSKTGGARNRRKSKKLSIPKATQPEVAEVVHRPASPTSSIRSGTSRDAFPVPQETSSKIGSTGKLSVVDRVQVVNEIPIRATTVKTVDDEEDGKDSDQTTDSTSSARSFNALLRHGSQESVGEVEVERPIRPRSAQ